MTYAIKIAPTGRIMSATYAAYAQPDMIRTDTLPDGDVTEYIYEDGNFVHAPEPKGEEPTQTNTIEERMATVEAEVAALREDMTITGILQDELAAMDAAMREGVNSVE